MGHHTDREVRKVATDEASRAALRREAELLEALGQPGVIRFVSFDDDGEVGELRTERVPGVTLGDHDIAGIVPLAALGAATAAVVADLHAAGVTHGDLSPDHILVSDGRIVLCSFTASEVASAAAASRDVAVLCASLRSVAEERCETSSRGERRLLSRMIDTLADSERIGRASVMAEALGSLAHSAQPGGGETIRSSPSDAPSLGDLARPTHRPTRLWRERVRIPTGEVLVEALSPRRRRLAAASGAGLAIVALAAFFALRGSGDAPRRPPESAPSGDGGSAAAAALPAAASTAVPAATTGASPEVRSDAVTAPIVHGRLIDVDGVWFEVGRLGDIVGVGDWDCDGSPSAALLRPGTGGVFIFEDWELAEGRQVVEESMTVPGAVALTAVTNAEGCDSLVIIDSTGRRRALETQS